MLEGRGEVSRGSSYTTGCVVGGGEGNGIMELFGGETVIVKDWKFDETHSGLVVIGDWRRKG